MRTSTPLSALLASRLVIVSSGTKYGVIIQSRSPACDIAPAYTSRATGAAYSSPEAYGRKVPPLAPHTSPDETGSGNFPPPAYMNGE